MSSVREATDDKWGEISYFRKNERYHHFLHCPDNHFALFCSHAALGPAAPSCGCVADEVASWYFEVWNEPNLSGFWLADQGDKPYAEWEPHARSEYLKLYETTVRAVKEVSKRYRVGGPATAGNAWLPETIEHCSSKGIPIDFVSTHHYAVLTASWSGPLKCTKMM